MQCNYYDANRCRSCSELTIPYPVQLDAKQADAMQRLAGRGTIEWLAPVASAERHFRNKAKMVVAGSIAAPLLGIRDAAGQGVDLSSCELYPPAMQAAFPAIAEFITAARIEPYDVAARRGELKFVLLTRAAHDGALMARFVARSQEPLARMRAHLRSLIAALPALEVVTLNLQPEHKAIVEGEREIVLTERDTITMRVNGIPLHLRPRSFFQTNDEVAAALYATARDWVGESAPDSLWDLYCGVGGFALHCAPFARSVTGVEESADAVASASRSANELGFAHVDFVVDDALRWVRARGDAPSLVVVNPPRRGIGAQLARWLDESAVRRVVYSSCNVESLVRDLDAMPSLRPLRARVLDLFPHTRHYEVLVLLERHIPDREG